MSQILLYKKIIELFSFKRIAGLFIILSVSFLLLSAFILIITANNGIESLSHKLAKFDPKTNKINIYDPLGRFVTAVDVSSAWPLQGAVILEFGQPDLSFQPLHTGIDIALGSGLPLTTFMKGKILTVSQQSWGYGKYVVVDHGNNITSLYAHMGAISVKKGQEVSPGDLLGYEGDSGWTAGAHLHFQVNVYGVPVNPRIFVNGNP